jgi:hypothetical protein
LIIVYEAKTFLPPSLCHNGKNLKISGLIQLAFSIVRIRYNCCTQTDRLKTSRRKNEGSASFSEAFL